ncbi:MAG: ribulose-phosphate 3-epimerase [Clostridiales bacterium]|nr:ribulose-phosphate 3-epimerase [Clostridiales bacterium]
MTDRIYVAPSVLSADFTRMGEEVASLKELGADYVHLDVMDGNFVPNITFGAPMCRALRPKTDLVFDAHLMVAEPAKWVKDFAEAGADIITFHAEADIHAHRTAQLIRSYGKKAGIALNPATHHSAVEYLLESVDMVLVMSVNPGFGGQKFIYPVLKKIEAIRELALKRGLDLDIEVDGGVNETTAKLCRDAGANVLVAGNAVFKAADRKQMISLIRGN